MENDLDNVLQIPNVFINVSKGQVAPKEDLAKSFGAKTALNDVILEILNKGELQVGEKERQAQLERVRNEVIDIVASKLVDPKSKRVYTTGMIEKALDQLSSQSHSQSDGKGTSGEIGTATLGDDETRGIAQELPIWKGIVTTRSSKSQALDAMRALIAHQPIPVARARMRVRITCSNTILKQAVKSAPKPGASDATQPSSEKRKDNVKEQLLNFVEQVESQDTAGEDWEVIGFVEPGVFKILTEFISNQTKGRARAEVLDMAVVYEGE